jgi:hypothetical protein
MATAATRVRPGNLTASLVAFAALELLFNRLATRLFLPQSPLAEQTGSAAARLLASAGPLLFHLTGVLALLVLIGATAGLLWRGELFPQPMRLVIAIIGLPFWLLTAYGVVFDMVPARFFPHLEATFGLLSMLIAGAVVGVATRGRVRLGVVLCALPGVLEASAIFGDRMGLLPTTTSAVVARAGELALLIACLAAPFLLPPRPRDERPWRRPLAVAATLTLALLVAMTTRFDLLQAALLYGLRLELPRLGSPLGVAYVGAFFAWSYATVQLLVDKGGMRLAGYGLVLLAIAGYQVTSPVELALSLLGLLALSVGELRAAPYGDPSRPRVGVAAWRDYVGRLATAAGDGTSPDDSRSDAVVVEEGELEVSRIRAFRRGWPVLMRLVRRRGALVELEMTVGEAPHAGPDASIERPRNWLARGGEHRVRLPRARTGDAAFDQKLAVHGHAPLGDATLRDRLVRDASDGAVSLWRGAAARYHVVSGSTLERPTAPFSGIVDGEAPVANVVAVLDTLADLLEASAPAA